jgi:hypothetical protein
MIGSTSFVAEGAMVWVLCEAIVTVVEVSSLELSANVGHLFLNAVNQEQGTTLLSIKDIRPPKHCLLSDLMIIGRRS